MPRRERNRIQAFPKLAAFEGRDVHGRDAIFAVETQSRRFMQAAGEIGTAVRDAATLI